jgi:hypothetical protein
MEKAVWHTIVEPMVREHLTRKYVPIDPLVYKVTAVYWLFQELVSNWKRGHRLTLDQKAKLLQLLVWNFARLQQEQAAYDEREFPEDEICCECLDNAGETVPYSVDINISHDTTEQIAELVLACKEFQ